MPQEEGAGLAVTGEGEGYGVQGEGDGLADRLLSAHEGDGGGLTRGGWNGHDPERAKY